MNYKFTIKGTLPGLNELIEAERRHRQCGAKLKKQCEAVVMNAARQMGGAEIQEPVYMVYHWYEKDRRRDKDNICAFGRKVIQDALVKARYLCNDGWKNIRGFEDHFEVDAKNPRVVVEIWERDETEVWRVNTCKTCRWYASLEGVCCNGDSEHRADLRLEDETCEK